jgi:hypothetical protein
MGDIRDLQEMDAVAGERGMVLAFRACENNEEYEPVFLRFEPADPESEAAMFAITDRYGMSLGRYIVPRNKLDAAIAESRDSFAADCSSTDRLV